MVDDSGEFKDMKYAERFICNKDNLIMLSGLEIMGDKPVKYLYMTTFKTDFESYKNDPMDKDKNYKGKTTASSANKINSVFVALEIPYQAMVNRADGLKIFKYGNDFDPKNYACKKAQRINEKGQLLIGSEPTKGTRKRVNRWISEEGIKQVGIEVINKIGYKIKK
ncbi:MAG: hypothetical protein Q7J35_16470 [Candidatus Methanoperedens sp.]|nr:hypothetical protein [Candidatus Methanoperedens sp.]